MSQQSLLRAAMRRMTLTREVFATRLGVSRRALDTWLLPDGSKEHRSMPDVVERFVTEILQHHEEAAQRSDAQATQLEIRFEDKPQLVSIGQLNRDAVENLFHLADQLQPVARRQKVCRVLEGAVLANLFFEASTRTRISFGAAFCRLGGAVLDTTGFTFSSIAKGESLYDTSRVISGYADAMVIRHPEQGSVAEFARATNLPLINAGDGPGEHPSQALLDLYTIEQEFERLGKRLDGACIAMVGDLKYGRTVHSLIRLLSLYRNLRIDLISPEGLEMPGHFVEAAAALGHEIRTHTQLGASLKEADVVYATRIQKERLTGEAIEGYRPDFQINQATLDTWAKPDVIVMHPLPRDSRPGANDLSADLNHDARLAIFRQTDQGIPIRMAVFASLLGVADQVVRAQRDAPWRHPAQLGPDDASFYGLGCPEL